MTFSYLGYYRLFFITLHTMYLLIGYILVSISLLFVFKIIVVARLELNVDDILSRLRALIH